MASINLESSVYALLSRHLRSPWCEIIAVLWFSLMLILIYIFSGTPDNGFTYLDL